MEYLEVIFEVHKRKIIPKFQQRRILNSRNAFSDYI